MTYTLLMLLWLPLSAEHINPLRDYTYVYEWDYTGHEWYNGADLTYRLDKMEYVQGDYPPPMHVRFFLFPNETVLAIRLSAADKIWNSQPLQGGCIYRHSFARVYEVSVIDHEQKIHPYEPIRLRIWIQRFRSKEVK